jgi:hypothetical protein
MEVLDRIGQALQESLERTAAPEPRPEAPGTAGHAAKRALDLLAERQGRLQASLDRAGEDAARAEAALAAEAEDLERWLREGRAARERLADRAGGAG